MVLCYVPHASSLRYVSDSSFKFFVYELRNNCKSGKVLKDKITQQMQACAVASLGRFVIILVLSIQFRNARERFRM